MYMNDHIPRDVILRTTTESSAGVQMRLDAGAIAGAFAVTWRELVPGRGTRAELDAFARAPLAG